MEFKVFWSWQADLKKNINKHFIGDCLANAVKQINRKRDSGIILVIERDTKNKTGAPNIVSTVFGKINDCQVFVGDVSIVQDGNLRSFPNPNVLIELGYALKCVAEDDLLLVFNKAYGEVDKMPFNIMQKRLFPYSLTENATDPERRKTIKSMTERFQHQIQEMYKRFLKSASILEFEGSYEIHEVKGPPIRKTIVSVTATDHSTLATKCEDGEMPWEGKIQISKTNPSSGQGEFT